MNPQPTPQIPTPAERPEAPAAKLPAPAKAKPLDGTLSVTTEADFGAYVTADEKRLFLLQREGRYQKEVLVEYDARTGKRGSTTEIPKDFEASFAKASPDVSYLIDKRGQVLELATGKIIHTLETNAQPGSRSHFIDDRHVLISQVDTEARMWDVVDVTNGKVTRTIEFPRSPTNISHDGRYGAIETAGKDGAELSIYDTKTKKAVTILRGGEDISVRFCRDGIYVWDRTQPEYTIGDRFTLYKLGGSLADGLPNPAEIKTVATIFEPGKPRTVLPGNTQVGRSFRSDPHTEIFGPLGAPEVPNMGVMKWRRPVVVDFITGSSVDISQAPRYTPSDNSEPFPSGSAIIEQRFGGKNPTTVTRTRLLDLFVDEKLKAVKTADLLQSIQDPTTPLKGYLSAVAELAARGESKAVHAQLESVRRETRVEKAETVRQKCEDLGSREFAVRDSAEKFLTKLLPDIGNETIRRDVAPALAATLRDGNPEAVSRAKRIAAHLGLRMRYDSDGGYREAKLAQAVKLLETVER